MYLADFRLNTKPTQANKFLLPSIEKIQVYQMSLHFYYIYNLISVQLIDVLNMIFHTISDFKEQLNRSASQSKPFLFAANFELSEFLFVENPLEQNEILFQIRGVGNKPKDQMLDQPFSFSPQPISRETYAQMFSTAIKQMASNTTDVINLTVQTPLQCNLSLREIFMMSKSLYQIYVPERFVCFSPERHILIHDGVLSTNPMKGTIDASVPDAKNVILNDPKEIEEHTAVIEMVKREIAEVASDVQITRFRYIDDIAVKGRNILQVSSEVCGKLQDDYRYRLGDIVAALLPASSIMGAPDKARALSVIQEAEPISRGYYTGVMGYFDGSTLDTGVLIRFIEQQGDQLFFRSGGGITQASICDKEYDEVLNKVYLQV